MKKNKTTRSTKKSYSSVKEMLKDNNSKIKLTPFNCKEVKFGKILTICNPCGPNGKFDVIFRRASTSERFFEYMEKQRPNQILWNEEEQQAYFLASLPEGSWAKDYVPKAFYRYPNYCGDLNAVHEAIMSLEGSIRDHSFRRALAKSVGVIGFEDWEHSLVCLDKLTNATASQRAEAFLRTIGKWKEEVK